MDMSYSQVVSCRTCKSSRLREVLDLGNQPLANALTDEPQFATEPTYPLRLIQCSDCGLVQINVNVDPKIMFSEYSWVTGTSGTSVAHCQNFATIALGISDTRPNSVLEIGSNDGTLLEVFANMEIKSLVGVDPAVNLVANYKSGVTGENLFFSSSSAKILYDKYGFFDFIIARNVFSHIPDFIDVISGVKSLLQTESTFFMEFHWVCKILEGLHYDSIYHEHTYYHSVDSVNKVFEKMGLTIFDAFTSPISGGSLVVAASLTKKSSTTRLDEIRELEFQTRVTDYESWRQFGASALENLRDLKLFLEEYKGKKVCAFGASARSSTILNAIGEASLSILSIADNNSLKWGKFSPGTGIPIESVEQMLSRQPELILIFPFNFEKEICNQISNLGWSGRILLPIPHPPRSFEI